MTAVLRLSGTIGPGSSDRLEAALQALAPSVSMVVLDLRDAHLSGRRAADAVGLAALELEMAGGCLLCANADAETAACLRSSPHRPVLVDGTVEAALLAR